MLDRPYNTVATPWGNYARDWYKKIVYKYGRTVLKDELCRHLENNLYKSFSLVS